MKFKYQQGGQLSMPYVVYQPTPDLEQNPAPQKKKSGDGNSNNADELYKMLSNLKDSLPGDLQAAQSSLKNLFESIQYKQQMGDTDSIAFEYLKALNLVSKLKYEAENYVKARDHAIEKGSLTEYAINSKGQVIVFSEEGFEWKTPEEIAQNPDKYQPITNQELLDYRAQGVGGLAFNSSAISTVQNSISMSQVTDIINNTVDKLGKDSTSEDGYAKIKAGQLIQGLQDFVKARDASSKYDATVEDLYVANLLTEDQAQQSKQALLYIYNMIPTNAMTLLKMKSNGTVEGAYALIDTLVQSKLSKSYQMRDLDLKESQQKNNNNSVKRTFVLDVQAGQGGHVGEFNLNNQSNTKLYTEVDVYEAVKALDGNYVNKTSMIDMLKKSGLISIVDNNNGFFFGNQEMSEQKLEDILYQGGAFARAELPVNEDGKIRFDLLEIVDKLELALLTEPDRKQEIVAKFIKENPSLQYYFNNDGSKRKRLFKPFLLFDGVTTRDLVGINTDNKSNNFNEFVVKIGSNRDLFENLRFHLTEANPSNAKKYKKSDYLFEAINDPLYKGVVYLPIHMSKESAIIGGNQHPNYDDVRWELEYQMSRKGYESAPHIDGLIQ